MKTYWSRPALLLLPLALALFLLPSPTQAQPVARNAAEIELALHRLGVNGSVLYVAAHPDDENTALLSYLASGRGVRAAYLSVTRGDGGQNLIGTEQGPVLGLIRTHELLAARRIDGAEQFFTRAVDFGYTKSPAETLRVWNHEEVLADVVWVIRRFRPDVVIARFPETGEGGHGQHTASAVLAREAFEAAGDASRFPEQLRDARAWRPKRLLWNVFSRQGARPPDADKLLRVNLGEYNPLLGRSYTEIAAQSRSMHKSQGMGAAERRGVSFNYFAHVAGEPAQGDMFDGVDLTWRRYPGGQAVGQLIEEAATKYDPANPQAILPLLVRAHAELNKLIAAASRTGTSLQAGDASSLEGKRTQLLDLIRACAGLYVEAVAPEPFVTPGSELKITTTLINRSDFPLRLQHISAPAFGVDEQGQLAELKNNEPLTKTLVAKIPTTTPPGQPYWLAEEPGKGLFAVGDKRLIGEAEGPAASVRVTLAAGAAGESLAFNVPLQHKWLDRVQGEMYRPVVVVPEVAVSLADKVLVFPDGRPKSVRVRLRSHGDGALKGVLRLLLPNGWTAAPAALPIELKAKGEDFVATFSVTPPAAASTGTLAAEFETNGRRHSLGLIEIDYAHVPRQTVFPPARAKLVRLDVQKRGSQIGYVMGSGDEVPEALRQIGYQVTLLSDEDLDGLDLARFDAIVTGVRAYNTRPRLRARQSRLLEYVKAGGTLVVQYNTADRALEGVPLGPYPLRLSSERVTIEEAPVTLLAPQDALLNAPNKINVADFDGWVQERGLYFAGEWDQQYQTLFEMHDPGEKELHGATLVARHGSGTYVHTSLAFFRQLPAGVPGAYRLFANLLSAGAK